MPTAPLPPRHTATRRPATAVFSPPLVGQREAPSPPRFDLWPEALRSAELLRGSLVRCGPGVRGAGWPETPRVRLAALAPWLEHGNVATHLTAAWVWGAARRPGPRIEVSVRIGGRRRAPNSEWLRIYELRYAETDIHRFGDFGVTTPLRTVLDVLHRDAALATAERVACRLLVSLIEGGPATVLKRLTEHRRPGRRMALERLSRLTELRTELR